MALWTKGSERYCLYDTNGIKMTQRAGDFGYEVRFWIGVVVEHLAHWKATMLHRVASKHRSGMKIYSKSEVIRE